MSIQSLLAAYAQGEDAQATRAGTRWARAAGWGALGLAMLASLGLALWTLWLGWQSTDWSLAQISIFLMALIAALPLILRLVGARADTPAYFQAAALRRALTNGDETYVPRSQFQPVPLPASDAPPAERVGSLMRAQIFVSGEVFLIVMLSYAACLPIYDFLLMSGPPPYDQRGQPAIATAIYVVLLIGGILSYLVLVGWLIFSYRRVRVRVDTSGMRWGRRSIPWASVRALCQIYHQPRFGTLWTIYLIETTKGPLSWVLSTSTPNRQYEVSRRLLRLLVANTGLPLRDASALVKRLTGPTVEREEAIYALGPIAPAHPRRARVAVWLALALVVIVPTFGLTAGRIALGNYQQSYFASLPVRLEAQPPRYAAALGVPTADWPVRTPTASDPTATRYQQNEYEVRGASGSPVVLDAPGTYGDAAVSVYIRPLDEPTDTNTGYGYGLVLRTDASGAPRLMFYLNDLGMAILGVPHAGGGRDVLAANFSVPSANTGYLQVNHLLVVMRGGVYLCYVNDQLAVTYVAGGTDAPPDSGRIGLWVEDGAVGAAFRDFAVYPVQPPSAFWYV